MLMEHRLRDEHQTFDSLSKKTEFFERLEQKHSGGSEVSHLQSTSLEEMAG